MNLDTFFEHFDQFAEAPNAVAKMRELILESAIRGNLVSQNTEDEDATDLLKRINDSKSNQIRKQVTQPLVSSDIYLEISTKWAWSRLGSIGLIFIGNSVNESGKGELAKVVDGLPFIATKDVGYGREALDYENGLKVPMNDSRFKVAHTEAVLICAEGGSAGRKIGITDRDICFGNKLFAIEVCNGILPRYVFYLYQTPTFFRQFSTRMTGIIGGISRSEFLSIPVPVPPLAEQKRIVAKIDELMALCDQLEAQQKEREERAKRLTQVSLARFAEDPTPENLRFIFHESYDVTPGDLRKSILSLAMRGKLVEQIETDGTAKMLLDLIVISRKQLEARRKIKRVVVEDISKKNEPFVIPNNWIWTRLGIIADWGSGSTPMRGDYRFYGDGVSWFKSGELNDNKSLKGSEETVTKFALTTCSFRVNKPGDVLLAMYGATIGKTAILAETAVTNQAVCGCTPLDGVFNEYLFQFLLSQRQSFHDMSEGGAQPNISKVKIVNYPFPLPPLAEQRRIVAKVDRLMDLVDEMEVKIAESRKMGAKLLEAVVRELVNE